MDTDNNDYVIRANIKTFSEIGAWVNSFSANSDTQWNARDSHPNGTRKIWKQVVCHHSAFMKVDKSTKRGLSKNAYCPARIRVTIELASRRNRNTEFMKKHTHSLNSAQSLRFLQTIKSSDEEDRNTRQIFFEYFLDNMTAAEAKNHHQKLLELRNASEEELANGRQNPTNDSIQYWYKEWRSLNLGPRSGPQLISKLEEKMKVYAEHGIFIAYEVEPLCICVITPLMQRAHSLPSAKEHLFIDTTSSCDPGHHSITFLLTSCPAGSIPLGLIITQGQTTEAYLKGFQLFQKTALNFAFGQKGYPTTILTDNSAAEIAAINSVWPKSTHFLCVFHILQAIWRWLFNADNKIQHDHRTTLMVDFKKILRAGNFDDMNNAYKECIDNGEAYPQWLKYVQDYWSFKEKWCLAYRDEKIRGHHTNNYSEANIRIFKDVVLSRVKAYNVISLVDFCATGLEDYHVTKLREFAHFRNRKTHLFFEKCLKKSKYLTKDNIIQFNDYLFLVPSQSNSNNQYTVDCDVGVCSCPDGRYGKFCKHQCAVFEFYELRCVNFPSITAIDRHMMAKIALGEGRTPDISFHEDFVAEEISSNKTAHAEENLHDIIDFNNSSTNSDIADESDDSNVRKKEELKDQIFQLLGQKIEEHQSSPDLIAALEQYKKKLTCISTSGSLLHFLHNAGSKRFKSGAKIGVQPTSLSRRKAGITRGSRRIASGRVAKVNKGKSVKGKRIHNIRTNVALGQRN